MSERVGSDIKRLWNWISRLTQNRLKMTSFQFRVVLCRIRLLPTLISKIKWLGSGLPLKIHLNCRFGLPLIFWFRHSSFVFKTFWCVRKGESEHIFMLKWVSGAGTLRDVLTWTNLADETTSVQHISQNYSSLFNLSRKLRTRTWPQTTFLKA